MNDTTHIEQSPAVREASAQAVALVDQAKGIRITNAEGYAGAGDMLKVIKGHQKRLEELRTSFTGPINDSLRAINGFFKGQSDQLVDAERAVKKHMIAWQNEQERIQRLEQAKAEEAARKERERLAAQAAKAAEKGKEERAQALEAQAAATVAPVIPQAAAPKAAGISTREVWQYQVTNIEQIPREYLMLDENKIGQVVRAMKGDTKIPGIRVWAEKSLASRAI